MNRHRQAPSSRQAMAASLMALMSVAPWMPLRSAAADEKAFTLSRAVPEDVFLCIESRTNPERAFLNQYWEDVLHSLCDKGVFNDVLGLVGSFLPEDQRTEMDRVTAKFSDLFGAVDWNALAREEMVFAERMAKPMHTPTGGIVMGPPDMLFVMRGTPGTAQQNYQALVALLEGTIQEVHKLAGKELLRVDRKSIHGADTAVVNLFSSVPNAPAWHVALARKDDLVIIGLGQSIFDESLALLDGAGSMRPISADPRFQAAYNNLPPAEDERVFFDMKRMMAPFHGLADVIANEMELGDKINESGLSPEARKLDQQALGAYMSRDYAKALKLVKQARDLAPNNCRLMYNVACFSALVGDRQAALDWLEKAVDAGFYAPDKIRSDSDLVSLHDDPRFQQAMDKATRLCAGHITHDVIENSKRSGKAYELSMKAWDVYKEGDYAQGLNLVRQAHEIAPNDSRVLYYLACFNCLTGNDAGGLDWLEKAVKGGFYAPNHIARDPDLESIRGEPRYEAVLAVARERAAKSSEQHSMEKAGAIHSLVTRLLDAPGILDYSATVSYTEGFATYSDCYAALSPNAKSNAFYPVVANAASLTNVSKYLPKETLSYSVSGGLDLKALYDFLIESLQMAGPGGEKFLATWQTIQAKWGFDVEKDLLSWIGNEVISVTLDRGKGSVLMLKVKDEEKARTTVQGAINFIVERVKEASKDNPMAAMMSLRTSPLNDDKLEGFEYIFFGMSPQPIVWGLADGYLIFSTSPDAVSLCLETARGNHPNIRSNERIMAEAMLPKGDFVSASLTDQRNLGNEMAALLGGVTMGSSMAMMFVQQPEARKAISKVVAILSKLQPVVSEINFFKSTSSVTTFDGTGWRTKTVTHYVSPAEREAMAQTATSN